jgi:predicted acetyltransferase
MPLDFKKMEEARRSGYPAADYFGVYAVENKQVASAVRVLRIPYTMGDGTVEIVSGIQGVVTRRESSRNGFARQLLSEVHERVIPRTISICRWGMSMCSRRSSL